MYGDDNPDDYSFGSVNKMYGVFYTGDFNNDDSIRGVKHDDQGVFYLSGNRDDAYRYAERLNKRYGKTYES